MSLTEQRKAIRDRFGVLEGVPGSGLHDKDPMGPVKLGQRKMSERPIVFAHTKYEMALIGDCAKEVVAALKGYMAKVGPNAKVSDPDPEVRAAAQAAEYYSEKLVVKDGQPYLEIRSAEWNAVLYALDRMEIQIVHG
jgi:hypothetical protein